MGKRAKIIGMIAGIAVMLAGVIYGTMPVFADEMDDEITAIKKTNEWETYIGKKTDKEEKGKIFKKCAKGKLDADTDNCKKYRQVCKNSKNYEKYPTVCGEYIKYKGLNTGSSSGGGSTSGSSSSSSSSGSSLSNSDTSGYDSSADYSGGSNSRGCVETSLFGCVEVGDDGTGIFFILNIVLTVMTYGVGILATVGIVWAGYTYLTAKDDASKIQKAKERIVQVVIGLVIYSVMWTALQFILPGGLFGNGGG